MAISADGYLNHLQTYLNTAAYGKTCNPSEMDYSVNNKLVLSEKIEGTRKRRKVELLFDGKAIAIKLDCGADPLFHFLDNDGHPWAKRCDFIIFQSVRNSIKAHCIEFKEAATNIPVGSVYLQLKAAEAWCRSLSTIINAYVGQTKPINLSKYIFTACTNPDRFLCENNEYLRQHPSIRHYHFDQIDGQNLSFLENSSITSIR